MGKSLLNFTALVRDPLVHFLAFGLLLFIVVEFVFSTDQADSGSTQIVVTQERKNQLSAQFSSTWKRQPTEAEIIGLIDTFVLEEIYYREALKLGLDKNDPLIRRRLQQKLEYMQEDVASFDVPDDDQLAAWYQQHKARFATPIRYSFQQILLRPEDAKKIEEIIASLNNASAVPGDFNASGLLETNNTALSSQIILNRFGESFSKQLSQLSPEGNWQGPVSSTFGTHLVLVDKVIEPETPDLSQVRERVMQEFYAERRDEAKIMTQNQLKNNYVIEIE